jgi:hypothetical protein
MKALCFFLFVICSLAAAEEQPAPPSVYISDFNTHRIAEPDAVFDECCHKLPAEAQPKSVDRYVWISRRTGNAFYVTIARAPDEKAAAALLETYARYFASAMPVRPPESGSSATYHFGDRRTAASWGRNVADVHFPGATNEPPAELSKVLDDLKLQFTAPPRRDPAAR